MSRRQEDIVEQLSKLTSYQLTADGWRLLIQILSLGPGQEILIGRRRMRRGGDAFYASRRRLLKGKRRRFAVRTTGEQLVAGTSSGL